LPTFQQARLRLATVLVQEGRLNEGTRQFEEVLQAEPQNGLAHKGLGYIHETQGHINLAIQHYEGAIAAGSADPGFHFHLGSLYLKEGNKELAKKHWENAVTKAPDFLEARYSLAKLLQQEGQRDEAIFQYRKLKAMVPAEQQYQALSQQVEVELHRLEKSP
jgi:Tfp pilus assembly protein PilF